VIDVRDFEPEGEEGICGFISEVCEIGWRRIIAYNFKGQRNFGAGLIAKEGIRIDVYGRVGDCLAAFADGPSFYVHGSVQDSVAYCFRSGRIVVYGDAGKAFGYGAKGGIAFILGDLMDRPFINAVGSVKAVINGSCLDYLGESFMAAHGFIILNGIKLDDEGNVVERDAPYQGGNLFSLAAAGAVYIRDPRRIVGEDQLNGAKVTDITYEDWRKILPLLKENERLFGIKVSDLLRVNGELRDPREVYRKIVPVEVRALTKYEGL
ncbi:MAG: glutamate synthase, partial [Thermofilum sp. ex4484_15]